jgi:hypothetical protein
VSKSGEGSVIDQAEALCPDLTYRNRIIGFAACCGAGWVLTLFAMISFLTMLVGSPATFAVVFSLSQVLNVAGICFLSGPKAQVRGLKKPGRLISTVLFFGSIVMTILTATLTGIKLLIILFVVLELVCYVWYCLSFFPFGQ